MGSIQIEIDAEVYDALKAHSTFEDTPNTVLRRVLGLGSGDNALPERAFSAPDRISARRQKGRRPRAKKIPSTRTRIPAGLLLPQPEYFTPIIEILNENGGQAHKSLVLEHLGARLDDRLTDLDREALQTGEPRWQSRAQFARLRLVKDGLLDGDSARGIWALTAEGRERAVDGTTA